MAGLTKDDIRTIAEDIAHKVIQSEVSKWATKQYFPDLIFEPGQVAMFNATHHRLMPSSTAGGGGHVLQDNGVSMTERTYADFQDGFVLADDSANDKTAIDLDYATTADIANVATVEAAGTATTVPRGDHVHAGVLGHTIREDGSNLTARTGLNFVDTDVAAAVDDAVGDETEIRLNLYAALAGRSGGQTIIGGTASGNSLKLQANSVGGAQIIELLTSDLKLASGASYGIVGNDGVRRIQLNGSSPHISLAGDLAVSGLIDAVQKFRLSGQANVTWAAQTDNYDPTTNSVINVTLTGAQTLTGIQGGTTGRVIVIRNVDATDTLTIRHDDGATSTAINRFKLPGAANMTLAPQEGAIFMYQIDDTRWYCIAKSAVGSYATSTHSHELDSLLDANGPWTPILGDMLYVDANPLWSPLPGNISTTKKYLTQTGSGAASNAPVWGTIVAGDLPTNQKLATINMLISGGGAAITTGIKGYVVMDFACTINNWTTVCEAAPTATDLVVDIKKSTYAGFAGSLASITGTDLPTITTTNRKGQSTALTGWTTSIAAGDILEFSVSTAPGTTTLATVSLKVTKT